MQEVFGGVKIIKLKSFEDERGLFCEAHVEGSALPHFCQDNFSISKKGTIRGMHYQVIKPQDKLVFVTSGAVLDVVVDLRENAPTFGKSFAIELSLKNHLALFVPQGFAHGFQALEDSTVFYKCSDFYCPEGERTLLFSSANILWKDIPMIVSEKDLNGLPIGKCQLFG